jgi:hypothetical protein
MTLDDLEISVILNFLVIKQSESSVPSTEMREIRIISLSQITEMYFEKERSDGSSCFVIKLDNNEPNLYFRASRSLCLSIMDRVLSVMQAASLTKKSLVVNTPTDKFLSNLDDGF